MQNAPRDVGTQIGDLTTVVSGSRFHMVVLCNTFPEQNPCKKSYVIHSRLGSSVARDRLIGSRCNFAVGISEPMPRDVGG